MFSNDVEIVLHSTVLDEDFVIGLWPMQRPAGDQDPVTYTRMEIGELARFRPTDAELRVIHRAKHLFGGMLVGPLPGETIAGMAA